MSVEIKGLPKPEIFHHQYSKMLDRYGFNNKKGKLIKKNEKINLFDKEWFFKIGKILL